MAGLPVAKLIVHRTREEYKISSSTHNKTRLTNSNSESKLIAAVIQKLKHLCKADSTDSKSRHRANSLGTSAKMREVRGSRIE